MLSCWLEQRSRPVPKGSMLDRRRFDIIGLGGPIASAIPRASPVKEKGEKEGALERKSESVFKTDRAKQP